MTSLCQRTTFWNAQFNGCQVVLILCFFYVSCTSFPPALQAQEAENVHTTLLMCAPSALALSLKVRRESARSSPHEEEGEACGMKRFLAALIVENIMVCWYRTVTVTWNLRDDLVLCFRWRPGGRGGRFWWRTQEPRGRGQRRAATHLDGGTRWISQSNGASYQSPTTRYHLPRVCLGLR